VGLIGTTTAERGFHGDRAGEQQVGEEKHPASQDAEGQRLPTALGACGFGPGTEAQPQLVDLSPDFRGTGEGSPVIGDLSAGNAGVVGVFQRDPGALERDESDRPARSRSQPAAVVGESQFRFLMASMDGIGGMGRSGCEVGERVATA
jgi:hypothetical protein